MAYDYSSPKLICFAHCFGQLTDMQLCEISVKFGTDPHLFGSYSPLVASGAFLKRHRGCTADRALT